MLAVAGGALAVVGVAAIGALHLVHEITDPSHRYYSRGSVLWAGVVVAAGALAVILRNSRGRRLLATGILCVDALAMFTLPKLSAPRSIPIDTAPAAFLQRNLGLSRYFSLGPLGPNYGSYYTIRELDASDNPFSSVFANYILTRLDPTADPYFFTGVFGPNPTQEIESHLDGYRAAGVRYVLTPEGVMLPQGPKTFTLVLRTPDYLDLPPRGDGALLHVNEPKLHRHPPGWSIGPPLVFRADDPVRRETYMPGWSARGRRAFDHHF